MDYYGEPPHDDTPSRSEYENERVCPDCERYLEHDGTCIECLAEERYWQAEADKWGVRY